MSRHSQIEAQGITSEYGVAAALEAKRLSEKYKKDFFDCNDLVSIMGIGQSNIRNLMRSQSFPTVEIGNRKVVSIISFTFWLMEKNRNISSF